MRGVGKLRPPTRHVEASCAKEAAVNLAKSTVVAGATSLWLIVSVAIVCRAGYAYRQAREIPAQALASTPFEQETGNIAMAVATGKVSARPCAATPAPRPGWHAAVSMDARRGFSPVRPCSRCTRSLSRPRSTFFFRRGLACQSTLQQGASGSLAAASLAAWLWAFFLNAIMIPFQWIWDTSLTTLLSAAILWATLVVAESQRMRDWSAYGLLWGFSLLTNPALGAALPFLLVWMIWRPAYPMPGERLARSAAALGLAILCCVPWTVRNYAQFHRWIPLRSSFPFELWSGNNEVFDPRSPDINARMTRYGEQRRSRAAGRKQRIHAGEVAARDPLRCRTHPQLEMRTSPGRRFLSFWLGSFRPVQDFENAGFRLDSG